MRRSFVCGCNLPGDGLRYRSSWPLAQLVIADTELRVEGRGLLRRLGRADVLRLNDIASAQAVTSRFGGGVAIEVSAGKPWYIFTFRRDEMLQHLRAVGVNIVPGSRRIRLWDQM
jgi:hypothetical protein